MGKTNMLRRGTEPIKVMIQGGWRDLKLCKSVFVKLVWTLKEVQITWSLTTLALKKRVCYKFTHQLIDAKGLTMGLNMTEKRFWDSYISTLDKAPTNPSIEVNIAGNDDIANELLDLFLIGKKKATSSLLKDYEVSGDSLPTIGHHWIILNKERQHKFYKSFDYKNTKDLKKHNLNAFVRMNGVELS